MPLFPVGDNDPIDLYPIIPSLDGTELLAIANKGTTLLYTSTGQIADFVTSAEHDVTSTAVIADNALVRGDGGARGVQGSSIIIDDNGNVAFPANASISWNSADVSITESANALAFSGAANGYSFDQNIKIAATKGIDFGAGDVTIIQATNTLTFAGASTGYIFDAPVSGITTLTQTGYHDLTEIAAPASPAANVARAYAVDDGSGGTTLAMKDSAGNIVPLAAGASFSFSPSSTITGAQLQAVLTAVSSKGGTVFVPAKATINITDQSVTIPANVELRGEKAPLGNITPANIANYGPRINIGSSFTLTLNNASAVKNFAIFRDGLTFNITAAQVASTFAGIGITLADQCSDQIVEDCIILGFQYGIRSIAGAANVARIRIRRVNIDCLNGVLVENSFDITYIDQVHCWPFVTVNSGAEANSAQLKRSGSGINLSIINDWTKVTNSFTYGYNRGFYASSADSCTFLNCSADYPDVTADGAIGFLVDGTAFEVRLDDCQAAAMDVGFYVDTSDTNGTVTLNASNSWETKTSAVKLDHGRLIVDACVLRNTGGAGTGVIISSTATEARIKNSQIKGFNLGISSGASTVPVYQDGNDFAGTTTLVDIGYKAVLASAGTLGLDGESTSFEITGTTTITAITPVAAYAGKVVTLEFTGACQVTHNGTTINLSGASDFVSVAGNTLSLYSNGTNWYEIGRTGNGWITYTPTITAAVGTFTSVAASGRFSRIGSTVEVRVRIVITTNGTAATDVRFTLPVTGSAALAGLAGGGAARDDTAGPMCQCYVPVSGTFGVILKSDNTYPGGSGKTIFAWATYEV